MTNNQTQPNSGSNYSIIKWTALTMVGCVVMIASLALAFIMVGRFLDPQIGGVVSHILLGLNGISDVRQNHSATSAYQSHPGSKFNTLGDPNAPVKMIEYADFQCPFC